MPRARRLVRGSVPRLHFVTPDVVERTVDRVCVAGILNARERSVFDAFALEKRRRDRVAGRLAVKRAMPAVVAREFNVSLAHANGTAIAAVARTTVDGSIAVDNEPLMPLSLDVVCRVMSVREIAALAVGERAPDPLAVWTVKEAGFKAARNVNVALREVEVTTMRSLAPTVRVEP